MSEQIADAEVVEGMELAELSAPQTPSTLFRSDDPVAVLARATELAKALAPVIREKRMFKRIRDNDHVRIEGWQTLGAMLGVTPATAWTRKLTDPDGWEARVEARTLDGRVVGAAEAECLRSEEKWEKAEDYAIRSMAQTRAGSKALSSVLRFVMTLGGFSGTPAEEMDGVKDESSPGRLATEGQAKMLWSVAEGNRGRKLKRDEAIAILINHIGVDNYDKVPFDRVDEAKAALRGAPIPTGESDVPAPEVELEGDPGPEQEGLPWE